MSDKVGYIPFDTNELNPAVFVGMMVFLGLIIYSILQWSKRSTNCNYINSFSKPTLSGIGLKDPRFNRKLYDYYVKSSYNSCASGTFTGDWVDMCALTNVIKQGYRFLDFEVYNINQTAVVSTSDMTEYTSKGTYNYLKLDDVIKYIAENAISNSTSTDECPNSSDPLFLHFRIKSTSLDIYNSIATSISSYLGKYLLNSEHSYENNGLNLGSVPIKLLMKKVIIIVDKTDKMLESSKLYEYVNIAGKSVFMRVLSLNEVKHTPDMDELIDFNRTNMTICTPNEADNYNSSISMQYGCQFSCLNAQLNDALLQAYNENFNEFAFSLKPENLRKVEVKIEEPPDPDMNKSYGYKTHKSDYYEFNL
jgi:hypothetical protein